MFFFQRIFSGHDDAQRPVLEAIFDRMLVQVIILPHSYRIHFVSPAVDLVQSRIFSILNPLSGAKLFWYHKKIA